MTHSRAHRCGEGGREIRSKIQLKIGPSWSKAGSARAGILSGILLVAMTALVTIAGLARMSSQIQAPLSGFEARGVTPALALRFEPLPGNTPVYAARGTDYHIALTPESARLALGRNDTLTLHLLQADSVPPVAARPLPTRHHYLLGRDPARWRIGIPTYGEIRYPGVYPGIDLVYYGQEGRLEYDFVVSPGADPGRIRLAFEGADVLRLLPGGKLLIQAGTHRLIQPPPHSYQVIDGRKRTIASGYRLDADGRVGFQLAAYDPRHPLVIDPVLVYASYFGGDSDDRITAMAVDDAGNVYLTGYTTSADLGSSASLDADCGSDGTCNQEIPSQDSVFRKADLFVTKLSPDGSPLFTTYLGGNRTDQGHAIAVDAGTGDIVVAGHTLSTDYPTTGGAYAPACTDLLPAGNPDGICDERVQAVVTRLSADGTALRYSTYLGGNGDDMALALALDDSGNAYVAGSTTSGEGLATSGAYDKIFSGHEDGFIAKLDPTGMDLLYATYLGGTATDIVRDIAVDASGNAYVTGYTGSRDFPVTTGALDKQCGLAGTCDDSYDAFVVKLNDTGTDLDYATYLGGEGYDYGNAIAVDATGNAYVAGETRSSLDFSGAPSANAHQDELGGSYDAFVARLNAAGDALNAFTYLGGGSGDLINDLALDGTGDVHVAGFTLSRDFPVLDPFYPSPPQRLDDAVIVYNADTFVARLSADLSTLRYASLYGGQHNDYATTLAVGGSGRVYFAGYTFSADLPVSDDAAQASHRNEKDGLETIVAADGFVAWVDDSASDLAVTLSDDADPIAQGETVTYTAVVSNLSQSDAQGVRFSYDIPQDTNLVASATTVGSCVRRYNTVICDIGRLAAGAQATITVTIKPRGAGEFHNTAVVTALVTDSNPSNNSASEITSVTPPFFTPSTGGSAALSPWMLILLSFAMLACRFRGRRPARATT